MPFDFSRIQQKLLAAQGQVSAYTTNPITNARNFVRAANIVELEEEIEKLTSIFSDDKDIQHAQDEFKILCNEREERVKDSRFNMLIKFFDHEKITLCNKLYLELIEILFPDLSTSKALAILVPSVSVEKFQLEDTEERAFLKKERGNNIVAAIVKFSLNEDNTAKAKSSGAFDLVPIHITKKVIERYTFEIRDSDFFLDLNKMIPDTPDMFNLLITKPFMLTDNFFRTCRDFFFEGQITQYASLSTRWKELLLHYLLAQSNTAERKEEALIFLAKGNEFASLVSLEKELEAFYPENERLGILAKLCAKLPFNINLLDLLNKTLDAISRENLLAEVQKPFSERPIIHWIAAINGELGDSIILKLLSRLEEGQRLQAIKTLSEDNFSLIDQTDNIPKLILLLEFYPPEERLAALKRNEKKWNELLEKINYSPLFWRMLNCLHSNDQQALFTACSASKGFEYLTIPRSSIKQLLALVKHLPVPKRIDIIRRACKIAMKEEIQQLIDSFSEEEKASAAQSILSGFFKSDIAISLSRDTFFYLLELCSPELRLNTIKPFLFQIISHFDDREIKAFLALIPDKHKETLGDFIIIEPGRENISLLECTFRKLGHANTALAFLRAYPLEKRYDAIKSISLTRYCTPFWNKHDIKELIALIPTERQLELLGSIKTENSTLYYLKIKFLYLDIFDLVDSSNYSDLALEFLQLDSFPNYLSSNFNPYLESLADWYKKIYHALHAAQTSLIKTNALNESEDAYTLIKNSKERSIIKPNSRTAKAWELLNQFFREWHQDINTLAKAIYDYGFGKSSIGAVSHKQGTAKIKAPFFSLPTYARKAEQGEEGRNTRMSKIMAILTSAEEQELAKKQDASGRFKR